MDTRRRDLPARPSVSSNAPRDTVPATPARPGMAPVARAGAMPTTRPGTPVPPARPAVGQPAMRPGAAPAAGAGHYAAAARPQAKGDELAQVIRQLTELLTKENASLKRHRFEEVKEFTERKEYLARLYQGHMNAIHRDATPLKIMEPARREALAHQAMHLGKLMAENASLLNANITSINMYFKAVTEAVREREEKRSAAYSRQGAMNGYIAKRSLAVSFNQTL